MLTASGKKPENTRKTRRCSDAPSQNYLTNQFAKSVMLNGKIPKRQRKAERKKLINASYDVSKELLVFFPVEFVKEAAQLCSVERVVLQNAFPVSDEGIERLFLAGVEQ